MRNKLNQPTFVIPLTETLAVQGAEAFCTRCDRAGTPAEDGAFVAVTFGARPGAMIEATPAKERAALIEQCVLAAIGLATLGHRSLAGARRVDSAAYSARAGVPTTREEGIALADAVTELRSKLARPATRAERAKAILAGE